MSVLVGPVMVLEYCETGQLDKWLAKQQGKASDDTIEKLLRIAMEIAQAMAYLSSRGVSSQCSLHRQMKAIGSWAMCYIVARCKQSVHLTQANEGNWFVG